MSDRTQQDRWNPDGLDEVTHQCPEGSGVMPCCGLDPLQVPLWHRLTLKPELVTCKGKDSSDD